MKNKKLSSIILSVVVAFGLWLYVINNVSKEDDRTFYNIPVVMEGESVLTERNLMITSRSAETVSLHLTGARSDLNKLDSSKILVKVNLTDIYEAEERKPLSYDVSFPAVDVPDSAFTIESRNPSSIYVDVDYRRSKEIPVQVKYTGTRSENYLYDTESAVLDMADIVVAGPAAAVDPIRSAIIEVDLTERVESISESFRYTLCNWEGIPVDAQQVTTNVEEVRLDMPIQRIKELKLTAEVYYGGGATEQNTIVTIEPGNIRVSGSDAMLAELGDTYSVGKVNLTDLDKPLNELTYAISLPEGIANQTGVAEAVVKVQFTGLKTREFTISNIESLNVPEGLTAEIISAKVTVKVRGPAAQIDSLTAEDITAVVDFSSAEVGTATYRPSIRFAEGFEDVGTMRTETVSATVLPEEE